MAATVANLQVVIGADTSGVESGVKKAQDDTKSFGSSLKDIGKSAGGFALAQIGVSSFTDVLGIAKDTLGGWLQGAMDAQVAQAHLNQILQSGQHVAGLTADAVSNLVDQLSSQNGMDDDAVQSAANVFAGMGSLSKEAYPQVTQAALQMARAQQLANGGQLDAQGAADALRNALEKPSRAMATLKQYGVELTAQDQTQINTWQKKGDQADIQALIMKRVGDATKGAADAYGNTTQGKLEQFQTKLDNMGKGIMTQLLPALTSLLEAGGNFVGWLTSANGPITVVGNLLGFLGQNGDMVKTVLAGLAVGIAVVVAPIVAGMIPAMITWATVTWSAAVAQLALAWPILAVVAGITLLIVGLKLAYDHIGPFHAAVDAVRAVLGNLIGTIGNLVGWLADHLGPVIQAVGGFLGGLLADALNTVKGDFNLVRDAVGFVAGKVGDLLGALGPLKDFLMGVLQNDLNTIAAVFGHISDAVSFLIGKIGDLIGKLGQIENAVGGGILSHIPGFAGGTDDAPGGFAMVGESGPELMYVPSHSRIYPHGTGPTVAGSGGSGGAAAGGGRGISIGAVHVYGDDADSTARAVVSELNWQSMLYS